MTFAIEHRSNSILHRLAGRATAVSMRSRHNTGHQKKLKLPMKDMQHMSAKDRGDYLLHKLNCKLEGQCHSFTDLPRVYLQCMSRSKDSVDFSVCQITVLPHTVNACNISSPPWHEKAASTLMASLVAMEQ